MPSEFRLLALAAILFLLRESGPDKGVQKFLLPLKITTIYVHKNLMYYGTKK